MHGFWSNFDIGHNIFGIVRDVMVGSALCYVKFWMDRLERKQEAHEKEVAAKLGTADVPPSVHARGASAGKGNGLHTDAGDSAGHGPKRGPGVRNP